MINKTKTGKVRFFTPHAIRYASEIYDNIYEALAESVSNSVDGGATLVRVYLNPDYILIVDNGRGMVPFMSEKDSAELDLFFEGKSRAQSLDELRAILNPLSLRSLEWFVECIGLSGKLVEDDPGSTGNKGIGALAPYSLADVYFVDSKPSPDLAKQYWGNSSNVPTYRVEPPTATQLKRFNLDYNIVESPRELLHRPDPQGTRIEIKNLKDLAKKLRVPMLVDHFSESFGKVLKTVKIEIIDNLSKEGRAVRGAVITLKKAEYLGAKVIEETAVTKAGEKFPIEIWYDAKGRGLMPRFCHVGKSVPLSQIAELQRSLFCNGQFSGEIYFFEMNPRRANVVWDSAKSLPNISPERTRFVETVLAYEPVLRRKIEEQTRRSEDRSMQRLSQALPEAVAAALKDMHDLFGEQPVAQKHPPRGPRQTNGERIERREKQNVIRATVFNEHDDGVAGVRIILQRVGGDVVADDVTGNLGSVVLGEFPDGKYNIRMVAPKNATVVDRKESYDFPLLKNHKEYNGFRAIFRIVTHEAPKTKRNLGQIRIRANFESWSDPDDPWDDSMLDKDILRINLEGGPLRSALDERDYAQVAFLLANYTASALCNHFVVGPQKLVLKIRDKLSAKIAANIQDAVKEQMRALATTARK